MDHRGLVYWFVKILVTPAYLENSSSDYIRIIYPNGTSSQNWGSVVGSLAAPLGDQDSNQHLKQYTNKDYMKRGNIMDINFFMKKVVTQLGFPALSLEKYYPAIKEILINDTLPVFSQFFPYEYVMEKNLTEMRHEKGDGGSEIYYIRDQFLEDNNLEIISVRDVTGTSHFDEWNAPLHSFNVEAMILEGVASGIRSGLNISTKSFQFLPPNRLKLRGYGGAEKVYITLKIPYPNFGAVPPSVGIELEKLAKLDIKCWLYPELRMYDKLETADGAIDLKIDDWADAQKERDDLLYDWRNKAFPNSTKRPYNYE